MSPPAGERTDEDYEAAGELAPRQRARVDALWAQLHGGGAGGAGGEGGSAPGADGGGAGSNPARGGGGPPTKGRAALDLLARLNRTASGGVRKPKPNHAGGGSASKTSKQGGFATKSSGARRGAANDSWARSLGLTSGGGGGGGGKDVKRASSEAALAAARDALAAAGGVVRVTQKVRTDGVVHVKETRNFAGKEMEVTKTYAEGSREAKQAAKRDAASAHGGLDSVLLQMEKTRKLNVLDKSKMDWKEVKDADAEMEEDLERHKRGKTYLEEQDFLKRAELREYEIERDARLAGDVRTRGRL